VADSLARGVLGILLEKGGGELPSVDLARVTTRSRTALRAYLEGERLFRAGEFASAVESYQEAIEADSTFALAYARLINAAGWGGVERVRDPLRKLQALSDQLPVRERRLAQALYDWVQTGDRIAAADTLRRLTGTYPDDPTVWYNLGEVLWHGQIPRGWPESEKAFQRAVELDPGVPGYHHHLVDLAFVLHRDSALAASRIAALPGREDRKRLLRLSLDLVFGSEEARAEALERVKTVPVPNDWALWFMLRHPRDGELEDRVLRILLDRSDLRSIGDVGGLDHSRFALVVNGLEHGHIRRAAADAEQVDLHPAMTSCYLAGTMALGVPVPDSVAASYLEPSRLGPGTSLRRLKCAGIYLVEEGRAAELEGLLQRLEEAPVGSPPWSTIGLDRSAGSARRLLLGYRAWKAGDTDEAARLLAGSSPWDWWSGTGAIWRGDFYRDLGRLGEAEGWYLAAWWHPVAHERLGRLYEEMGEPEKAASAYRRFIAAWEDADEGLQSRVEAARERVRELTGSGAEPDG
jgi:tetratricopeptide (TPR) repeat protein